MKQQKTASQQKEQQVPMITLNLDLNTVNVILKSLSELPAKESMQTILEVQNQTTTHLQKLRNNTQAGSNVKTLPKKKEVVETVEVIEEDMPEDE